jgi:hypothetical protein
VLCTLISKLCTPVACTPAGGAVVAQHLTTSTWRQKLWVAPAQRPWLASEWPICGGEYDIRHPKDMKRAPSTSISCPAAEVQGGCLAVRSAEAIRKGGRAQEQLLHIRQQPATCKEEAPPVYTICQYLVCPCPSSIWSKAPMAQEARLPHGRSAPTGVPPQSYWGGGTDSLREGVLGG